MKLKLTPEQIIDQVMELDLPSTLQTNIYQMAKAFDTMTSQNKFLLMISMGLMAEFDPSKFDQVLNGEVKIAIPRGTLERISKVIGDRPSEKPVLCYNEEGEDGFLMLKWESKDPNKAEANG